MNFLSSQALKKRLLFSLATALLGVMSTYGYFEFIDKSSQENTGETALAYIGQVENLTRKKMARHRLWQEVQTGDLVYNNESIKTGVDSDVEIHLANSARTIDLEPESLVTIKKQDGEILLNLMEGSLSVQTLPERAKTVDSSLPLHVLGENGNINLSEGRAKVTKSTDNRLLLEILEGNVSLTSKKNGSQTFAAGKKISLEKSGIKDQSAGLEILSPKPNTVAAQSTAYAAQTQFKWKKSIEAESIRLLMGPSQNKLNPVEWKSVSANEGIAPTRYGVNFYRLQALSRSGTVLFETPVQKYELIAKNPLQLMTPSAGEAIPESKEGVMVQWHRSENASVEVILATDPQFQQVVQKKNFDKDSKWPLTTLRPGRYYLKLNSRLKDQLLSTQTLDFSYGLVGPAPTVAALTAEPTPPTVSASVPVPVVPQQPLVTDLQWDSETQNEQNYLETPSLKLKWVPSKSTQVKAYRVLVSTDGQNVITQKISLGKGPQFISPVEKPGRYIASIEALDQEGKSLGELSPKEFLVRELERLKAPEIIANDKTLVANLDGTLMIAWKRLLGAKDFTLELSDEQGKLVKKWTQRSLKAAIKNLKPGRYKVRIDATDIYDRPSQPGDTYEILVADQSDINAPKLKKLSIDEEGEQP